MRRRGDVLCQRRTFALRRDALEPHARRYSSSTACLLVERIAGKPRFAGVFIAHIFDSPRIDRYRFVHQRGGLIHPFAVVCFGIGGRSCATPRSRHRRQRPKGHAPLTHAASDQTLQIQHNPTLAPGGSTPLVRDRVRTGRAARQGKSWVHGSAGVGSPGEPHVQILCSLG
jgi:hypothetical protein